MTFQIIDRIECVDRKPPSGATCKVFYRECCEQSNVSFTVDQFQRGEVKAVPSQGKDQRYFIQNDVHTLALHTNDLAMCTTWFEKNALIPSL